ncbi:uncharacterized protein [Drosophila tropicalis]|uniref:uncharacterized protein n=1 Tax=Drosophila tropicalis TaxID=46794 RepID=UPI0035AC1286
MLQIFILLLLLLRSSIVTPTVTVIEDIRKAFKGITNDSELVDHIIPEMYGPFIMSNANPTFVFRMPSQLPEDDGFEILAMKRSDFTEPIFPNVTEIPSVVESSAPPLPETNVKTSLVTAPQGQWQQIGLEGWTGELQRPQPWLEEGHKDKHQSIEWQNTYPRDQILLNLKNQHFDGRVTDIRVISANNGQQAQLEDLMDEKNVYIARVNDPFGYSMKWKFNNASLEERHQQTEASERGKRDVTRLYSMIKCSTSCDPLIFKGYGCYCGFGGQGVPTDGIDRCCRLHDKCYGQSNCISYLEYFVPYVWKCYRGKPLCAIDHGEWGGPESCAARLCQCDLQLSRCLRRFYCPRRRAVCHSSRSRRLQNLIFFD